MAEVVAGVGTPHTPLYPMMVKQGGPNAQAIERLYGEVGRRLADADPTVVILFTCDHLNAFLPIIPTFAIGAAERVRGPSDYAEHERCDMAVATDLAWGIHAAGVAAGFDLAIVQELELDHSLTVPLQFLELERGTLLVPVYINGFTPPAPSAERCFALGRLVREAVAVHEGERVAVLASGSFSLDIGGARTAPGMLAGVPDGAWAERVVELLAAGDVSKLVRESTPERLAGAGNVASEVLTWIAMLGALGPGPPRFLEAQADQGHAYAAWDAGDPWP